MAKEFRSAGQCCHIEFNATYLFLQEAPYILEDFAKGYDKEDPSVRLALLSAAAKLFFKRPPESQLLLGGLLSAGVQDDNQDVHDRALLYFR